MTNINYEKQYRELAKAVNALFSTTDYCLDEWDHMDETTKRASEKIKQIMREHKGEQLEARMAAASKGER